MIDLPAFMTTSATAAVTAAIGLIVWLAKDLHTARKREDTQSSLVVSTMLVIMRHQLVTIHRNALIRLEITAAEKQVFLETHELYVKLGGNGATSHLIDDIKTITVVAN